MENINARFRACHEIINHEASAQTPHLNIVDRHHTDAMAKLRIEKQGLIWVNRINPFH